MKIYGCDEKQPVAALDTFAWALPPIMILLLKEWMMMADDKSVASQISFDEIIVFIMGKSNMRAYRILSGEPTDFDL